jgi:hypothetical protein
MLHPCLAPFYIQCLSSPRVSFVLSMKLSPVFLSLERPSLSAADWEVDLSESGTKVLSPVRCFVHLWYKGCNPPADFVLGVSERLLHLVGGRLLRVGSNTLLHLCVELVERLLWSGRR